MRRGTMAEDGAAAGRSATRIRARRALCGEDWIRTAATSGRQAALGSYTAGAVASELVRKGGVKKREGGRREWGREERVRDEVTDSWTKGLVCNRFYVSMVLYVNFWTKVINRNNTRTKLEKLKGRSAKFFLGL